MGQKNLMETFKPNLNLLLLFFDFNSFWLHEWLHE
jgi:hypothetical protein